MKEKTDLERILDHMKVTPDNEIIYYDGQDFIMCPRIDFKAPNSHDLLADVLYDHFTSDRSLETYLDAFNFTIDFISMVPGLQIDRSKLLSLVEHNMTANKWRLRIRKARAAKKTIRKSYLPIPCDYLPF